MLSKLLWVIAISFIFLNSIYFGVKLKFPQFNIKAIIKTTFSKEKKTNISAKDSLFISLASKLGVGSLAGISFAIYYGGIGTIFWIWISTFFVCINSYLENSLAIIYKEKDGNFYKSGPAYYIKKGLNNKTLAIIYAILLLLAYIFGFLTIQNNTINVLVNEMFGINKIYISLIVTFFSTIVILKGLKQISNICNKIVPFMTILYFVLGLIAVITNIELIPNLFTSIFKEAFAIKSITGGLVVAFIIGMQKSIFASESGTGTSAIAAGTTDNNDYKKQGYIGIIETYFINFVISTITGLLVMLSDYTNVAFTNINGIELTKYAFSYHFGIIGEVLLLIILVLFAFSTIITGYYYGESNLKFITDNKKMIIILKIISIIAIFVGGIISSLSIWNFIDLVVALLTIINIYSIYKLRHIIFNY